jgi:methyl-coenzyme M reductase gamma subunit
MDPGTLSGRQIIECRERDLEKYAKELVASNLFDPARTGIRGATVHGHSLRLAEDGMMFDMLQRCVLDKKSGVVNYVKNQIGEPLDKPVKVGKPLDEKWLKAHTTIYNSNGSVPIRDDAEAVEYIQRIHSLRTKYGFMPME